MSIWLNTSNPLYGPKERVGGTKQNLECWLWDMVNTMVQRQQKSEHALLLSTSPFSSALLFCCVAVAVGMGCEILRIPHPSLLNPLIYTVRLTITGPCQMIMTVSLA
jgi:uncharacterized membrane protein AbrB (regulator of aidB expression)